MSSILVGTTESTVVLKITVLFFLNYFLRWNAERNDRELKIYSAIKADALCSFSIQPQTYNSCK